MKKLNIVFFVLLVFVVDCSTVKKNNCGDLYDKSDYTIINGVGFYDTFTEREYEKDENGKMQELSRYIEPDKMEYMNWILDEAMFKITEGSIIKAGKIRWDKTSKVLVVRDVDKITRDKNGIKSSERRLKYKIENNTTYHCCPIKM